MLAGTPYSILFQQQICMLNNMHHPVIKTLKFMVFKLKFLQQYLCVLNDILNQIAIRLESIKKVDVTFHNLFTRIYRNA